MGLYRIAVLVGSLRRESFNRKLASAITLLAPSDFSFQQLALDAPTMGQPEAFVHAKADLFGDDGKIGAASLAFMQTWMDHYVAWVKQQTAPSTPPLS